VDQSRRSNGVFRACKRWVGSWMTPRSKMPFVFFPGVAYAVCSLGMALATGSAFWFLTLFGINAMFEIMNPWLAWAGVRFGWGLDALLLAVSLLLLASGSRRPWWHFPSWAGCCGVVSKVARGCCGGKSGSRILRFCLPGPLEA
jgi:hypothetical protein